MLSGLHIQLSLSSQPVTALTNRTHHVIGLTGPCVIQVQWHDLVKGLVHGGSGEIVHGGINDAKVLVFSQLQVLHLRDTHASVSNQRASWLDNDLPLAVAPLIQHFEER